MGIFSGGKSDPEPDPQDDPNYLADKFQQSRNEIERMAREAENQADHNEGSK